MFAGNFNPHQKLSSSEEGVWTNILLGMKIGFITIFEKCKNEVLVAPITHCFQPDNYRDQGLKQSTSQRHLSTFPLRKFCEGSQSNQQSLRATLE